jgi:hypothetical protein
MASLKYVSVFVSNTGIFVTDEKNSAAAMRIPRSEVAIFCCNFLFIIIFGAIY